jgi:hypothetical protein
MSQHVQAAERERNTTHTRKGLCCVAFVMAFRKRNGTSQQALKTDLPTSVGGCGRGRRRPRHDIATPVRPVDIVTGEGRGRDRDHFSAKSQQR